MSFLALAWRNVWRHRRRTLLTVSSTAFGLAAVMFGQSLMKTIQTEMVEKSAGMIVGDLQVQARDVEDPRVPQETIDPPRALERALAADPRVKGVAERFFFTGLIYSASGSRGVLVCGIDPTNERRVSMAARYIAQGREVARKGDALIGDRLAKELDVRLGEKVVLMAQAKSGDMNSELFRVAGIFHTASESYDGQLAYVELSAAQRLRGQDGKITSVVARLADVRQIAAVRSTLGPPPAQNAIREFAQIDTGVTSIQRFEDAVLSIVLSIIFLIVGLGILNTVSMALFERIREFGVLRSIGARPASVLRMLLLESLMLGLLGAASGLAFGAGLIQYFSVYGLELPVGEALSYFLPFEPVIHLRFFWALHLRSFAMLVVVGMLAGLGPALRGSRMKIVDALRHV